MVAATERLLQENARNITMREQGEASESSWLEASIPLRVDLLQNAFSVASAGLAAPSAQRVRDSD